MTKPAADRLAFALDAALGAGAIAMRYFQDPGLAVDQKLDRSVVTLADREAEAFLRERLDAAFPDDAVIGEELGVKPGRSGWTWHLDPIDGTQAYARGVPLFGTLIGAERDGRCELGVIFMPALGELLSARTGDGTRWRRGMHQLPDGDWSTGRETLARVSTTANLSEALFCTTWMQSYATADRRALFDALTASTGVSRGWGDCYGYALVATGRAEVMVDPVLASWDAAPMPVILSEAGGLYTTLDGREHHLGGSGVATNGRLHPAVLALTRR
jgi:histidinol phosphatase-like enzyme (inositol monophosphatase family)